MAEIEAKELKNRIDNGERLFLLDVRTREEYKDWRIEGSTNIPISELKDRLDELRKGEETVVICAHGVRSGMATQLLAGMGMNVKTLAGGMAEWNCIFDIAEAKEDGYEIIQFRRLGKGCLSYMIASEGKAAVFDPSFLAGEYLETAGRKNLKIEAVIDTHQHADHISGARWLARLSKTRLYLSPAEGYRFSGFEKIKDGQVIGIGKMDISCIAAPGHTKGSMCFLINSKYFLTGDTLLIEGIGRPDLKENTQGLALPEGIIILPGHFSPSVKIGRAKLLSESLAGLRKRLHVLEKGKEDFISFIASNIPERPPNYLKIIRINRDDSDIDEEHAKELEEGPNRCAIRS